MAQVNLLKFSPKGDFFACCSADGTLRLWDPLTGSLKQEFTPTSHLAAIFTSLCWSPTLDSNETHKKKKRRTENVLQQLQLLALGTASGPILLYSVNKADLHTKLSGGHTDTVTCLCWSPGTDKLYSGSKDRSVVEWDVQHSVLLRKWEADKVGLNAMALSHSHLLTGSKKIKLWNLEDLELVGTLIGQASEILPVVCSGCRSDGPAACCKDVKDTYVLTASSGERLVSVWQLSLEKTQKAPLALLSLTEEPCQIGYSPPTESPGTSLFYAVTKHGQLLIFEHQLNGVCRKPIQPRVRLQVVSSDDVPKPIPVLSCHIFDDDQRTILISHGSKVRPTFERMVLSELKSEVCLVRDDPLKKDGKVQTTASNKVKTPLLPQTVNTLAPGVGAPREPVPIDSLANSKLARKRKKSSELTIEDRLNAMSVGTSQQTVNQSMSTLLGQGLQSKDTKLLEYVLQRGDDKTIQATIRKLPVTSVIPLLEQLSERIGSHAQACLSYIKWIRAVLTIHASYLVLFPDLVHRIQTLSETMKARCRVLTPLSRLQGKLDLVLSQVTMQGGDGEALEDNAPITDFQDESDEDMAMVTFMDDNDTDSENMQSDDGSDSNDI